MVYGWVTTAPIFQVTPEAVPQRATALRDAIAGWGSTGGPGASVPGMLTLPAVTPDKDYNRQIADGQTVANNIAVYPLAFPDAHVEYWEYRVAGSPVAMMVLDRDEAPLELVWLVAHPGAEAAGVVMVEHALNRTGDGKLQLKALDGAVGFYAAIGFVAGAKTYGTTPMALNAATVPARWRSGPGGWIYTKFEGKAYLD